MISGLLTGNPNDNEKRALQGLLSGPPAGGMGLGGERHPATYPGRNAMTAGLFPKQVLGATPGLYALPQPEQQQASPADAAASSPAAGQPATGSLEQRFPNSAGKFPLTPFQPIPAGLPYQQTRDIISTGGLPQGTPGSNPSQALEALEWLRSKIATIKR